MKKFLTFFLIITMIFSLAACGSKTGNKWEYSKDDLASFNEVFSEKALDQDDDGIDIIYISDVEPDEKISEDDVLVFNYNLLEEDVDFEYVSYDLIKKHQIATEKIEITTDPDRLLVYFYGDDDLFVNYGVLISKDATRDRKYVITKTNKEYLGGDSTDGDTNVSFAPLFTYLDAHGVSVEQLIEDGVISEPVAERIANNDNQLTISVIGMLCSYLGCKVEDIVKYEGAGVYEAAHEIDWNIETVKKQDYECTGVVGFYPLRNYLNSQGKTVNQLVKDGIILYNQATRISYNHNFTLKFIMYLCGQLQTDVSNIISFEEYN